MSNELDKDVEMDNKLPFAFDVTFLIDFVVEWGLWLPL